MSVEDRRERETEKQWAKRTKGILQNLPRVNSEMYK